MLSGDHPFFVDVARPGYLLVLVVLPLVVILSRRSLAGLGSGRRIAAISLRCLLIAVMVLALAVPEWIRTTDDQTVTFAIDHSDSIPQTSRQEASAFIKNAVAGMRPSKDRVATMGFAGRALVKQLPNMVLTDRVAGEAGQPHRTNIAGALRLGMALFLGDTAKRLVIISDGNENSGVAAEEADAYAALGIPIDVLPLRYEHDAEILVDQLTAPATAARDESIVLQIVVRSQIATTGQLMLYRNDEIVDLDSETAGVGVPIRLAKGPNRYSISIGVYKPGVHRFRAIVVPDDASADAVVVNNEGRAFTIVGGASRVMIVTYLDRADTTMDISSAEKLAEALHEGGIDCELLPVEGLPSDPAALTDCSAVILSNVPAYALDQARMAMLASYVRDQGGGLIAVGGDRAFSVGGYADTLLEEILPVETKRDELRMLSLAMVIVIDRSGSMTGEKISMARQGAIGSVRLLSRLDQIGVVVFDSFADWAVPLQLASNRDAIIRRLDKIGSGGGTDMYPALQLAATGLSGVNTNMKHIIVLTDGQSMPGDFDKIAQNCRNAGISISTIAVGPDADRFLLDRIAKLSGGRMYMADTARPLPQIFARETIMASRAGLYEQPFTPTLKRTIDDSILTGIDQSQIPTLRGHVVSDARELAQTSLVRKRKGGYDPILAHWQVGLGRTVAFTSGMWNRWGPEWVSWSGFSKIWTQAVRYVARTGNPADLEIETTLKGGEAYVSVTAEHLPLAAQGSLTLAGEVIGPDFAVTPLELQRTAAGRFEAVFPVNAPGTYLLNMPYSYGAGEEGQVGMLRAGVVQSYSPEYRSLHYNENTLVELARRTGGRVLDYNKPEVVFDASIIRPVDVRRPFWEELIKLALVLFLLDVAVRRIAVSPAESMGRLRRVIHDYAGSRTDANSEATLDALRGAKGRAKGDTAEERSPGDIIDPAPSLGATYDVLDAYVAEEDSGGAVPSPKSADTSRAKPNDEPASDRNHTARLLRAKRRAHRQDDQD